MSLNDMRHVEAVAIMRRLADAVEAQICDREAVKAADVWLYENHPGPAVYMAAMSSLPRESS